MRNSAPTPPRVPGFHPADQVFIDLRGEEDAESVAGEEEAGCFVPHVDRPRFDDVGRGGGVFAGHREADDEAEEEEEPVPRRECAGDGAEREHEDREDHCGFASPFVAGRAEDQSAEPPRDEGRGNEGGRFNQGEVERFGYQG